MSALNVALLIAAIATVTAQGETDTLSCDARNSLCYRENLGYTYVQSDGRIIPDAERKRIAKDTSIPIMCSNRKAYLDCAAHLMYNGTCQNYNLRSIYEAETEYQFVCLDRLNDTNQYWKCWTEVRFSAAASACGSAKWWQCSSFKDYLDCWNQAADTVNVDDCRGPGLLDGVKIYNREFTKLQRGRGTWCRPCTRL